MPRPAVPVEPPAELAALRAAVDAVLALDLCLLPPGQALELTRGLLVERQRLEAATLGSVSDLDSRQLYTLDGAGSTRSWLAQQPVARTGLAAEATRLAARPLLRAAVAAGQVSAATADTVAALLARLPQRVEEHQLTGVLRHAVPALLTDRGVHTDALHALVDDALGSVGTTADRLEPACVLLARHLPPTTLALELRGLVDALLPERLADDTRQSWSDASLTLQQRSGSGWSLRGHLDDQTGQQLHDALHARLPEQPTGPLDLHGDDHDSSAASEDLSGVPDAAHSAASDAASTRRRPLTARSSGGRSVRAGRWCRWPAGAAARLSRAPRCCPAASGSCPRSRRCWPT